MEVSAMRLCPAATSFPFHLGSFTNVWRLLVSLTALICRLCAEFFGIAIACLVGKYHGLVEDHNEAMCIPPRRQLLDDDLVLDR